MKYLKTFESMTNLYDFDRCTYISDDKSIVGAYMITGETDKLVELLNIKEIIRERHLFMDNAQSYDITIHRVTLPKSMIHILSDVEGKEGFKYVKMPYWLYKKNITDLDIKRIKGAWDGVKYKKRLDIYPDKLANNEFYKNFSDDNIINYIKQTNNDLRTYDLLSLYSKGDY